MKLFKSYKANEEGSTAVEFGMVSLLFLTVLFGIIELSQIFWTWNTLQYATESTARFALAHPEATDGDLVAYAGESMSGIRINIADLALVTTQPVIGGISFIEVNSTYTYTTVLPFLPAGLNTVTLRSQSRMPYSL